jgi:DNA-binding transcriptional LysR family regulator
VSHANRAANVPALIAAFRGAHPDVAISVTAGVWRDIVADIRTGAVDVGFAYLPSELPPHTHYERLASGSMVLVCSRDHPLVGRTEIALAELQDETIICVPASSVRRTAVDEALDAAGVSLPSIDVARLGLLLAMVRIGLGVGIMPGPDAGGPSAELVRREEPGATAASDGHARVCYVPIRDPAPRWSYAVVAAPPDLRTPAAKAFLALLDQQRAEPR